MRWIALVPIKPEADRKTRLAGVLSPDERAHLAAAMLSHVLDILAQAPEIDEVVLLAARTVAGWEGRRIEDRGRGLNAELAQAAQDLPGPLLVIHADLPLLSVADLSALLATPDVRIAPDRHGTGTNAIALPDTRGFVFRFGPDSCVRHRQEAGQSAVIVDRIGLAMDVDNPTDLEVAATAVRLKPGADVARCAVLSAAAQSHPREGQRPNTIRAVE